MMSSTNPPPALAIHDANNVTVFKIESSGKIAWRPQGSIELVDLSIESDLSIAFALCVELLSTVTYKSLLEDIRKKAVHENADKIAGEVAQYLIDIKHINPKDKDVHIKNITTIVNGI